MRVFVNAAAIEVERGTDVRGAIRAHDPALEFRLETGGAYVTDARGIEVSPDATLSAGAILRVVVRAGKGGRGHDADA